MVVLRQVVFPALRLLVWTVIAVALCVLAFGGGRTDSLSGDDALVPTADTSDAVVPVTLGSIASTVESTGTVAADPAVPVKATAAGTVRRVRVAVGERVEPGTAVLDIAVPLEPSPASDPLAPPPPARFRTVTVTAGAAGTLASMTVLKDQAVEVGGDVATVSPGTLSVSAPLTQAQQFRLLTPPAVARAQAPGGPAPFDCVDVRTGAAAAAATPQVPDPYTGTVPEAATARVTCKVPPGTTVFAGMSVDLALDTGSATDVLVVPVTAVQGTVGTGTVWVPGESGQPEERAVGLGLTDGVMVQVTEGLAEGDEVLEFTPVPSDDQAAPPGGEGEVFAG